MDDLHKLFSQAVNKSRDKAYRKGLVGKHNVDTTVSYAVTGRADFLYVTLDNKTVITAINQAGVPQTEDYPVLLRKNLLGQWVIIDRDVSSSLGAPTATPPSGVIAHATSHQHGGSDEVATATPGANAIVKADGTGKIGNGWLDAELSAIAGLTSAADRLPYFTGSGTAALATFTTAGRNLVDDADASAQRTTLGLVIGTNVQAYDATLLSIAALGTAADKMIYTTDIDTWAEATITTFGRSLVDDANASAARTTLGLVIGTNVQAYDATLLSIAALGTAANKMLYTTGIGTWAEADITAAGRAILDDADASAQRTTLGLGTIATEAETAYALLAGRASSQVLNGGTAANEDLTLRGTSHATKTSSYVLLQDTGGFVGIGTTAPATLLHAVGGTSVSAGLLLQDVTTDATAKQVRIKGASYTNSEEPITGLILLSDAATTAELRIGGGSGVENAVSSIKLYTGATSTTLTGTARLAIDSAGAVNIPGAVDLDTTLNVDGVATFQAIVNLSMGTQDYEFSNSTTALTLQGKTAGSAAFLWIFANDGDGTDSNQFALFGKGTPSSTADRERLLMIWDAGTSSYQIYSEANGTGTLRPLILYTEGNTSQLYLDTSGNVGIGLDPVAKLDVLQATLGSEVLRLTSTATNDDPTEDRFHGRVATTNATVTTVATVAITASNTYMITADIICRRTGGASGNADDGGGGRLCGVYSTVTGTVTLIGSIESTFVSIFGGSGVLGSISLVISGTNVLVRVTGIASYNITWHAFVTVKKIGS